VLAAGALAPQSANQIPVSVGLRQNTSVGGFDYAVTGFRDVGTRYKQTYDQRGTTVHPLFGSDSLVLVNIAETNHGDRPVPAVLPDLDTITVFDRTGIGYVAAYMDVRQTPDVRDSSDIWSREFPGGGSDFNLMLAPGGTLRFAVLASVPKNDPVTSVVWSFPGTLVTVRS